MFDKIKKTIKYLFEIIVGIGGLILSFYLFKNFKEKQSIEIKKTKEKLNTLKKDSEKVNKDIQNNFDKIKDIKQQEDKILKDKEEREKIAKKYIPDL